jgi:hypothetical protein
MPEAISTENRRARSLARSQSDIRLHVGPLLAILFIVAIYVATVTPGHAFLMDDFAGYVMHAANLAEGHSYTDIRYVPNPETVGFAPAHGYPPVYPLILAPVYKIWGLNLRAMKIVTVTCFGISLGALALLFEGTLPPWAISAAILIVGFNIVFWEQRDYLLSEFPYLMFSFCALLTAQKVYEVLDVRQWRIGAALLLSLLLYATYGTRTIGIVLLPALVLADLWKFRRPSRFLILVLALTTGFILLQNMLMVSPKAYVNALHMSVAAALEHIIFYGKTLSYVWRNGVSKSAQIAFALLFTAFAAMAFSKQFWNRKSVVEFYLLGYLAVLVIWSTEIGMRGLLPVLPLYFAFGLEGFVSFSARLDRAGRTASAAFLLTVMGLTYLGAFRWSGRQQPLLNVRDPEARELFAYLKQNTAASDLLVFQKPRTLALYTNRETTMLAPDEPPAQSGRFFASTHARFLIQNSSMGYPIRELIADKLLVATPVFQNDKFQVYQITFNP